MMNDRYRLELMAQIAQMLLDKDVEVYEERGMQQSDTVANRFCPDGKTTVRITVPNLRKTLGREQ